MNDKIFQMIEDNNFKTNYELLNKNTNFNNDYGTKKISFFNDDEINKLIKNIRGYLNKTKYNKELKNYLTLIIVSLIEMNGKEIEDIIYKALKNSLIYFENGTTKELGDIYGVLGLDESFEGVTSIEKPLNLWDNEKIIIPKTKIIVGKSNMRPIELLDSLTHEFRHNITSIRNTNYFLNKSTYFRRMGLAKFEFLKEMNMQFVSNDEIDEGFNTYYSEVLVNKILAYKNLFIDNDEIKQLLKLIKNPFKNGYYYSNSYLYTKQLIQPLTNNYELCMEINKQTIKGNIDSLNLNEIGDQLEYVIDRIYTCNLEDTNDLKKTKTNINNIKTKILERSK